MPEVPAALARKEPPRLPELAENEIVRHFTNLADRNFGIDTGFYPLGSCTMKYNPRVNERVVAAARASRTCIPHQEDEGAQGALELMWELQQILAEVAGLPAVTLQPAAGSQGELTGLMLMRAYFDDRGEGEQRDTIITADTAHGTNPASVTMAGYKLEKVATTERGNLDLDDLRAKVNERTAGLMLTNPSTLGLFDEDIVEVAEIFHYAGCACSTTTAPTSTPSSASRGPVTWASTSSTTTSTRRSRSRTAAAARVAARWRCAPTWSRSCPHRRSCATATSSGSTAIARSRSAGCADSPGRSASSCARTPSCVPTAPTCGRCPRRPS